ncbi:MAG: hypothetical protein PHP31_07405 [Lentimicrobiaceae bacterium]|nr:hypothetical protein [Lentimicrobiaceae bacterium]
MEILIKNTEDLVSLLTWALDDATILSKDLLDKTREFVDEIESNLIVTSEGKLSDKVEDLDKYINKKIANYLFTEYDSIFVSEDEKLIGIKNNIRVELYDGKDGKLRLDASML